MLLCPVCGKLLAACYTSNKLYCWRNPEHYDRRVREEPCPILLQRRRHASWRSLIANRLVRESHLRMGRGLRRMHSFDILGAGKEG